METPHCMLIFKPQLLTSCRLRLVWLVGVLLVLAGAVPAQTLTDVGSAAPTPGPKDISQLSTAGDASSPDGLNYYTDNGVNHPTVGEPGQTFTTGTNATGYTMLSLTFKTGGGTSSGLSTPQTYLLHLYSVSGGTATRIAVFSANNFAYIEGDWLKWSGLSVSLSPNTTYAYSFGRTNTGTGWDALANASANLYASGEIALIPTAGGAMTLGGSHSYDAAFDVGMFSDAPTANTPVVAPKSTVYIGQTVSLTESALGTGTLFYQWQTDGGGGSLTNIPGATGTNISAILSNPGTYQYSVIVTNLYGSSTSGVASVTVLPPAAVTVNVANTMATMPPQGLGVCTAVYDNVLINSGIAPLLKAAGITALRYPGGSYADIFNWQTTTVNGGYVNSSDSFDNFMNTDVNPAGAQAIVTVNYGSNPANNAGGDPLVAAAWVAHANVTNHWGVKYWEIGNEIGGNGYYAGQDWEYDLHFLDQTPGNRVGQAALSPAAYGTNSAQFIAAMKAQDPTILCGVGFSPGNNSYNTPLLKAVGTNADFVIIHWYPGNLTAASTIPATVTSTLVELTNQLGAAQASQMNILVTETGAGSLTGTAVALYTADNYLTWIENGIVNVDYQILHTDILQNNQTPGHAYYGAMMSHLLANVGDTFVATTSGQSELRVHATVRQDGKTGVMLLNTDPLVAIAATVTITNGTPLAQSGTGYQFGLTNYIGANDFPSYPVSTNSMSGLGNQFAVVVPAYTMIDLVIPPASANTPPALVPISSQNVNVGQTVAFVASATDTDQPPQTLTFSLLTGATNATLDAGTGAFSWRPQVTDADTTNAFSLKVADSGTPTLSATQSFLVTVNPLTLPGLTTFGVSNGQFGIQVTGQAGPDYAVQSSTDLVNWAAAFITNSPPMPFLWTDTNAANLPALFFRIKTGPPLP